MNIKRRPYEVSRRREAAAQTRRAILEAAARLFVEQGYTATTMAAIADAGGVAVDTVYAAVGPKPLLFRLLVETAISGADEPIPAEERDYVRQIRGESDPGRMLELYASAVRAIQERLAALFRVLQMAASANPELDALWQEIADRRARNMHQLAQLLAERGGLREDVSAEEAADVIWAMNGSEFYALLVDGRGWKPERYERWLAASWKRLLLNPAPPINGDV